MEIQLETPSPIKKIVNIEVDKDTVNEELAKEVKKVRKKAKVKGFRKGKVPITLIKKMYGDSIRYEVLNKLLNESLSKAIYDNKINYVGDPSIKDVSEIEEDKELKITAEFDCIEEFEVENYKGIKVEIEKLEVTDEIFDNALKNILSRFTYFEDVEDEDAQIEEGDQVVADIEVNVDGEKDEELSKTEAVFTIGENHYLPEFDNYFIGMTKNDETVASHEFHKDDEIVKGDFTIKVKWIKKPVVPELDEDFISQFGEEYGSVEDFKSKIKEDLESNFKEQMKNDMVEQILEQLRKHHNFQFPEILIDKQVEFLKKKSNNKLVNESDEDFEKRLRESAEKQIRNSIILEKIEKTENIKPSQEDIDKELQKLAIQFRVPFENIKEFYLKNNELSQELLNRVSNNKVFDFLIENAEIIYKEKESENDKTQEENDNEKEEK